MEKLPEQTPAILILRDFQRFLEDISISRKLRNLAKKLKSQPQNLVILAPQISVPEDLSEVITIVEFPLPNSQEIAQEVERLLIAMGQSTEKRLVDEVVRAAQGLSIERIRRVFAQAIATHGELQPDDVDLILEEKRQTIRQTQILIGSGGRQESELSGRATGSIRITPLPSPLNRT